MNREEKKVAERRASSLETTPLELRIRMASDARLLPVARSTISELAATSGFEEDQCRMISLAVDEALSNVIRHSYKSQCDQQIELNCQTHSDCLEFVIVDFGEPWDLSKICAHPLDDVSLGGRGTHLIRQIMDEVCYERVADANRLRLKKYLPGARDKAGFAIRKGQET
jgi:serine/threonine-protein kinase RsbW